MQYVLIILGAIILSAFFSGMEIAFISANKLKIELDKKQGGFASGIIDIFNRKPDLYITTMLIGNNIALVIFGLVMAIVLEPLLARFLESDSSMLLIQTIISALIILFTAEFMPKTLFRINPNAFLKAFAIPVFLFYSILFPLTYIITQFSNFLLRYLFNIEIESYRQKRLFNRIDISNLISYDENETHESHEAEPEIKIFQNALDFSKVKLRDCMIPRPEICSIDINDSLENIKQKFIETGYSKIIVYSENIDNVIGYVNCKELFKHPKKIEVLIVKIPFFPETMPANKLLEEFAQQKKSMALVVDEFGGTAGLVTIEDILEEIFGEIEDEHDSIDHVDKKINDNLYVFSGRLEIDYLNEKYRLNLPKNDEYETIAGFILYHHESLPKLNETIEVENFEFKVLKVTKTRVELIRLLIK